MARFPLVGSICMLPIHESTPPASVPCRSPNRPFLPSWQGAGTIFLPVGFWGWDFLGAKGWVPGRMGHAAHTSMY
jgi:hypothetical protein